MLSFSLTDNKPYKQKYNVHFSMDELSKKLNNAKSEIDKPKKEGNFSFITTFFEMSKMLKQRVSREFNIFKVSNAYLKQFEILSQFPEIIKNEGPVFTYFDNASFPGAFIRGTDHYIKNNRPNIKYLDWFASSLYNGKKDVLGDEYNLLYNYPFRWLMSEKNNGDVVNPDNILNFRQLFRNFEVPLYTSDLGFDVSADYSKQEIFHLQPNIGQICCALETVRDNGTQITKQFSFFELRNKIILYILTKMYKKVNIIKPITSKPDNSEVYILCMGYDKNNSLKYRELILNSLKHWDKPILEEIILPEEFNKKLTFIANELYLRQIDKIKFNIDLFYKLRHQTERVNLPSYFYQQLKREVDTWLRENPMKIINDPLPITKTIMSLDRGFVISKSEWDSNLTGLEYLKYLFRSNLIFKVNTLKGKTLVYESDDNKSKQNTEILFNMLVKCGMLLRYIMLTDQGIKFLNNKIGVKLEEKLETIKEEDNIEDIENSLKKIEINEESNKKGEKENKEEEKKARKQSWADIDEQENKLELESGYNHWYFIIGILLRYSQEQITNEEQRYYKNEYELINCLERFLLSIYNVRQNREDSKKREEEKNIINKLISEIKEKKLIKDLDQYKKYIIDHIREIKGEILIKNDHETLPDIKKEIILKNNTISYGLFSYDFNQLEPERTKYLLNQGKENVLIMLLKYSSMLSAGQQWSAPQSFFDYIYSNYEVKYEGFASPLNSRLMLKPGAKFCSLFSEVDNIFGSIGNFFDVDEYNDEGKNWLVNPPFIESILEQASLKSIKLAKNGLVIFIMPNWTNSKCYQNLSRSNMLIYKEYLHPNTYFYQKGKELIKANFASMIFVLNNKKMVINNLGNSFKINNKSV